MGYNLAERTPEEMDKINADLMASGVAFKERYNMPVIAEQVQQTLPAALRPYFAERLVFYRERSVRFSRLPYEPAANKR